MKKQLYLCAALLLAAVSTACGGKTILTEEGLGCLTLGTPLTDIPASCDGLYDTVQKQVIEDEMDGDYVLYEFRKSGETIANIYDYGYSSKIENIEVLSENIETPQGIHPGMSIVKMLAKGGMKFDQTNDGAAGYKLGNFRIRFQGLSEKGGMKLENAYMQGIDPDITPDDFESDACVTSIFCGRN